MNGFNKKISLPNIWVKPYSYHIKKFTFNIFQVLELFLDCDMTEGVKRDYILVEALIRLDTWILGSQNQNWIKGVCIVWQCSWFFIPLRMVLYYSRSLHLQNDSSQLKLLSLQFISCQILLRTIKTTKRTMFYFYLLKNEKKIKKNSEIWTCKIIKNNGRIDFLSLSGVL